MKKTGKFIMVLLISCMGLSQLVNAASWSPLPEERDEKAARGIMEKGALVCLFQSGTADVKKEMRVNDIIPAYRESRPHEFKEVGKIKVLSYVGEYYLKGEVVEGELKAGDMVKKGGAAGLIISPDDKCR
jgi:hypothetical protein